MSAAAAESHPEAIKATVDRIDTTVGNMEDAVSTVKRTAANVESHVSSSLQPDLRELRMFITELNEKADLRLKRLYRAVAVLAALQVATILLVILG